MSTFNNQLSLYIPRITPEVACEEFIKNQFLYQNIGKVERVDLIHKTAENGTEYYQAFIHFKEWMDNITTRNIQERINAENPQRPAKLVFDDPWYWIMLRNNNPRTEAERRVEARIKALELAMQENHLIASNIQTQIGGMTEDFNNRLYDLELEYQAMMHSDAAREELTDAATAAPSWATPMEIDNEIQLPPTTPNPSFATIDDDREIEAWEDKHRIMPDAPYAPYRSLSELDRHSAECRRVVDEYLGYSDGWCDP